MQIVSLIMAPNGEASQDGLDALAVACKLARNCDQSVTAVLAGHGVDQAIASIKELGPDQLWVMDTPVLGDESSTDLFVQAFHAFFEDGPLQDSLENSLLLLGSGSSQQEIAARLAARLRAVPLGECFDLSPAEKGWEASRMVYGGKAVARVQSEANLCVATLKAGTSVDRDSVGATNTEVKTFTAEIGPSPITVEKRETIAGSGPSIEAAGIIVSGGRGMGSAESFAILRELAQNLGGVVGASLPAVDAGWMPSAHQVGQTGKFVSPEIYIAVGISGASQHLAGIRETAKIVAINKDPKAPIFSAADVGVVANYSDVLPTLIRELEMETQLERGTGA